jgi:ubiquinone/menaquinone biosynthesis C-methylase UbiE
MGFDENDEAQVALWDELPLWSAHAGALLLDVAPVTARRMLDLGCGTGFPLFELAERLGPGAHAVGVDPWTAALARARAKRGAWPVTHAELVRGDGTTLPFRDGAFDLVVSNLGVNNFENVERAFREAHRVLQPGGAFALSSNLSGHFRQLYQVFGEVLAQAGDSAGLQRLRAHIAHRATVRGLEAALVRHGFRVEEVHEREVAWRFRDGAAVLAHHFVQLGFAPAWREVMGGPGASLEPLRLALDACAGTAGLSLSVPLVALRARRA